MIDTVIMGNRRLWDTLTERDKLYEVPEMTHEAGMRLGELEGIVGEEDGYSAESDAAILLQGLDIADDLAPPEHGRAPGRTEGPRAAGQALFGHPQALLLDEPTNHLDLDSIHWLRRISEPVRRHAHRDLARPPLFERRLHAHRRYRLPDDHHLHRRLRRHGDGEDADPVTIEADNAQREKKIAQLTDFIPRFGAGTRASQATARRKEVERLQTTELARSNIQRPYIKFAMKRPSGKVALEFKGLKKSFGRLNVIPGMDAVVNRGERIVLVGRNGAGKTTMLKALLSDAPGMPAAPSDVDAGKMTWGHEVSIGYFPQDSTGLIQKGMTAVEWLHQFDPDASRQDIHGLLGQMLFSGEEGLKPTDALSGGETARLLFCRIMLQKPNVLILDEPTNHLDLESINALNIALQKFEGTILLVTHDQDLLEEVGTRVWQFDNGRIVDFKGTYEELTGTEQRARA